MDQPGTPRPEGDPAAGTAQAPPPGTDKERDKEQYHSFDGFLRAALREEYKVGWKDHRDRFICLLIASGQAMSLAAEKFEEETTTTRLVTAAGALVLLRYGLRFLARGPIGAVIAGGATAAAVAYVALHYQQLAPRIQKYRTLIAATGPRHGEIQAGLRDGRFSPPERDLMVDGLLHQFLEQVRAD